MSRPYLDPLSILQMHSSLAVAGGSLELPDGNDSAASAFTLVQNQVTACSSTQNIL